MLLELAHEVEVVYMHTVASEEERAAWVARAARRDIDWRITQVEKSFAAAKESGNLHDFARCAMDAKDVADSPHASGEQREALQVIRDACRDFLLEVRG